MPALAIAVDRRIADRPRLAPLVLLLAAISAMAGRQCLWGAQPVVDNLQQTRLRLEESYRAELEELAAWCEGEGLSAEARVTRQAARPRDPWKIYVIRLPSEESPAGQRGISGAESWQKRFHELGQRQAKSLLALARQAMRAKHPSLAYELILETLRADPDNEEGRKLLGFIKYKGGWHTPFEVEKLKRRNVWDSEFGWLPQAHLARYKAGQRFYNGRWISAEEEAQIRSDIRSGWHIETEHYSIRTNHSLQAGVKLGQRLERLYRAWQQTFAAFYAAPDQLLRIFEGRGGDRRSEGPRHLVVYYRNREEYAQALRGHIPAGVVTTGIYLGDDAHRRAYFYASDEPDNTTTLYHEASHQLFSECREVVPDIGLRGNFWIVEGIACYMESFEEHDDFDTLGGTESQRLAAARYRLLNDQFYVPLDQFVRYGMDELQRDPRIATLYSQSAGLAHFLMHYGDGCYRDALIGYLQAVYTGEDQANTLSDLTGKSYPELDSQYREFMAQLPQSDKEAPP